MKRFDMITEAEARLLERGSTVSLAAGGHITPLAQDTLRERRVVVNRDDVAPEDAALAPPAVVRTVAVASDHTGLSLKAAIISHLRARGLAAHDLGTHGSETVDYPDTAALAARQISRGEADAAIAIDGSGLGSAVAANKIPGARAAMCVSAELARHARQHIGANVLTLGATLVSIEGGIEIVDAFIDTPMREARYIRRLAKVHALERRSGV